MWMTSLLSHASQYSKSSVSSSPSANWGKLGHLGAKDKVAVLEVEGSISQAEELELRQEMAQAKVEERIYQQLEREQVTKEME